MRRIVALLGIPIDTFNMDETIEQIIKFVYESRATGSRHQIATANTDFIIKALGDPELLHILQTTDLITADGMPLVWATRLLRGKIEERVAGSDFVPILAQRAAIEKISLYLLGAAPGVAARAAEILCERHPDLIVAGVESPPFRPVKEMDEAIIERINSVQPDILLVAFGNPKQEMWIGLNKHKLKVPVMIGVGGTLDFISGQMKRAPQWMQRIGLEWSFRLFQEPRRLWKRYVLDMFLFSFYFLRQWWVLRYKREWQYEPVSLELELCEGYSRIIINGIVDVKAYQDLWDLGWSAFAHSKNLVIDLTMCDYLDSSGYGALLGLAKKALDMGGELKLCAPSKLIKKSISVLRLEEFLQITEIPDYHSRVDRARVLQI